MSRVVAVINQKGGVGKTTSAIQIGSILNNMGYRVLMVDMDPQCNMTIILNGNLDSYSILDAMLENTKARDIIQTIDGIDLIVSNGNLASYSMRFKGNKKEYRLKTVLEPIQDIYDFIIIDSPPTLGDITIGILTACDSFIIPATCDIFSLEGIKQIYSTYEVVKAYTNPGIEIDGILITRYQYGLDKVQFKEIKKLAKYLEIPLLPYGIKESIDVRWSLANKKALIEYAPNSGATEAYKKLTKYLENKWTGDINNG